MTEEKNATQLQPVVDFIKTTEQGEPYLEGHKCRTCGAIFIGARDTCSKCCTIGQMEPVRLSNSGTLYSYSIVYRSYPGVQVPFVTAIVDLDGGGTVKGNLIGVEPDAAKIPFGMSVQVIYKDPGKTDKEGNHYLCYFFQPRQP